MTYDKLLHEVLQGDIPVIRGNDHKSITLIQSKKLSSYLNSLSYYEDNVAIDEILPKETILLRNNYISTIHKLLHDKTIDKLKPQTDSVESNQKALTKILIDQKTKTSTRAEKKHDDEINALVNDIFND